MKKNVAIIAVLLLAGLANAAVTNLFPNGNFDSPAGANWAEVFGGGTTTYSYPTSGGNPGGYGIMNNTSGWGIWVGGATTPLSLTSLGLVAGGTYTFVMDMKNITGTGIGKLKIESWAGGVMLSDSGEIAASSQSASWATYSFPVTLNAGATGIKVVPVAGSASQIGFDNLGVIVISSPLAVSITSPVNSAVVTTNFSIDATAMVTPGSVTNVSFYDGAVLVGSVVEEPAARDVELDEVVVPPPLVVLDCVGCGRVVLVVGFGSAGGAMPGVRPAPKARPIAVPGAGLREAAPLLL